MGQKPIWAENFTALSSCRRSCSVPKHRVGLVWTGSACSRRRIIQGHALALDPPWIAPSSLTFPLFRAEPKSAPSETVSEDSLNNIRVSKQAVKRNRSVTLVPPRLIQPIGLVIVLVPVRLPPARI